MRRINPRNIINLLSEEFAAHVSTSTSVGDRLLADGIVQLIHQCMEAPSFDFEIEEILEISGRPKPDEEDEDTEPVRDPLSESQLKEALQYYRSTASGTRPLSSMMNRHKYIKGKHHIRQIVR
jgi:hypothetical protein